MDIHKCNHYLWIYPQFSNGYSQFSIIQLWIPIIQSWISHSPEMLSDQSKHSYLSTWTIIMRDTLYSLALCMESLAATSQVKHIAHLLSTHWSRHKMTIISQTFSNAFSWMEFFRFQSEFHWSLFLKGPVDNIPALVQIMAWRQTTRRQAIIWTNRWPICCRRIYASLGLYDLILTKFH